MHAQVTHFIYTPDTHLYASATDSEISHTCTHLPLHCHMTGHKHSTLPHCTHSHAALPWPWIQTHYGFATLEFTDKIPNWPSTKRAKREKKTGHSRMLGGGFKWGNSPTRMILGIETETTHLPTRILTVHTKALVVFSQKNRPYGLMTPCFPKATSLEQLPLWDECTFQGKGRGEEPLMASGQFMGHP